MLDGRRSRSAWLEGAQLLRGRSDRERALRCFERAVEADIGMADGWLGVHCCGTREAESLSAMARHASRFGEERERTKLRLASRFAIGGFASWRLETVLDLWCAVTAWHLDRQQFDLAFAAARHLHGGSAPVAFLGGRLARSQGAGPEAIDRFARVFGGDLGLEGEARLHSAELLAEAGAMSPAFAHLDWVLERSELRAAHAPAFRIAARIHEAMANPEEAFRTLSQAYARQPTMPGLAEDLERLATARLPAAAGPAEHRSATTGLSGENGRTAEEVIAELDRQIGQGAVKQEVRNLVAQRRAQTAREKAGLATSRPAEHFVFVGPPGTGKTTVARLLGDLYRSLGLLEHGRILEVDRSGLIGQYHGQTVAQTQAVIDEAMGGVLFIDEAYALQQQGFDHGDPFGTEAIDTLLKRMEDNRGRFVVIAAGYAEPMGRFLESNPGLKSRFTRWIGFAPYTAEELVQIAALMVQEQGDTLTVDADAALTLGLGELDRAGLMELPSFGNGRFVRTLVERAAQFRDLRLFGDGAPEPDPAVLTQIVGADLEAAWHEAVAGLRRG